MKRRDFLVRGAAVAGAVSLRNFPYPLFAGTQKKQATDRVLLGPRKIDVCRLAMGTGTNGVGGSSNQTKKLGVQGLADLFKAGYDEGLTFWDSADQYGSHPHVKQALTMVPREKVVIMTKTPASTEKEMRAQLDRYRRELNTDYIDIMLLHCMMDADWPEKKKGAMAVISEAQEKGIIRTHGTSCHTLEALKAAAANPWVEVDLARLNPAQVAMDAPPAVVIDVLKKMKASGKGVMGMKIFGAGRLAGKADEALQYALAQDVLDCFTIGVESRAQQSDLLRKIPAASVRG
jgi:predicted aldo/keto reductase-like oxidoreductase